MVSTLSAAVVALSFTSTALTAGQQPAASPQVRPATGVFPETQPDDNTGFVSIFDGKTLNGWDGDTQFWRVENGEIVGETTPEKVMKQNSFLIWRGGTVKDFELKVEFRLNGTNSGIQYRSSELPNVGKWVLKGYQADVDFTEGYLGNVHDERGRAPTGEGHAVLSRRGEITRIVDGPRYKVVGTIGDPTLLRGVMNVNGWNQYHIIARGPVLMQLVNGQLMAIAIDEDAKHAAPEGLLGFQMHTGPPFKLEYRNVCTKRSSNDRLPNADCGLRTESIADCRLRLWIADLGRRVAVCTLPVIALVVGHVAVWAAQETSSRAKETYARAIELDAKGNHPAALALLWEAAGLSPRDPEIQNALGEALDRIGALDAAIAAYRVAVHENPQFRKASNNLILALVKAGKGEEAVQRARDLAAQAPSDPDRYFTLGLAQSEQNIDDAMKSFRRALEIDPRHALARYNLALALNRTDRTTEAIEEMKKTLAIDPRAETPLHARRHVLASGRVRCGDSRIESGDRSRSVVRRRARGARLRCFVRDGIGKTRNASCGAQSTSIPIQRRTTRSRRSCGSVETPLAQPRSSQKPSDCVTSASRISGPACSRRSGRRGSMRETSPARWNYFATLWRQATGTPRRTIKWVARSSVSAASRRRRTHSPAPPP